MERQATRDGVHDAAELLRPYIRTTPIVNVPTIDELVGAEVWFKCENLQFIGAFKARGAQNAVARLSEDERQRGLVTYSSGNHAQAVALAAKRFGAKATIVMPVDAPKVKENSVRSLGAQVISHGTTSAERKARALEIAEDQGGTIVEPFDDPDIICGQGTATLEFIDQLAQETGGGEFDSLIVPVGGGGLLAGACLLMAGTKTEVYAVEPVGCNSMGQSIAAGELVSVDPAPTIADGLKPTCVGQRNFDIAKNTVKACLTVDDAHMAKAFQLMLMEAKLLVEPSGCAGLAALLQHSPVAKGTRVGVILSGGNMAPETVAKLVL